MDLLGHDPKHVEAVLVAADRLREAYEAMMEGRDVGWLAAWQPAPTRGAVEALRVVSEEAILYRDRCVQPGCDGQGFYSARCQSEGHRKEIIEYVPASQLRGAVEENERLRSLAPGSGVRIMELEDEIERLRAEVARLTAAGGQYEAE